MPSLALTRPRSPGRRGRVALLAALLAALLTGIAAPAYAHDELIGTSPAVDASVDALPAEIEMTFSGVILADTAATEIDVLDASCAPLTEGDPVFDGTHVRQQLSGEATGPVTVIWRVVSSDGHPVSGSWWFTVGDAAAATPCATAATAGQEAASGFDPTLLIVVGVVLVAGVAAVLLLARRRPASED